MTTAPIKVLQVVDTLGMGGAETWLMEVLRLWSRTGAGRMDFLATSGNTGIFDQEAIALGARIHYVRYGRGRLRDFARKFRCILQQGQYDAIHDHQDYTSGWHYLVGVGRLPPVRVSHVHNPWIHIGINYGVSPTRRLTATVGKRLVHLLATNVCGTSAQILEEYGFPVDPTSRPAVSVAHCGFDVGQFDAPRDADRRAVLEEFGWGSDTRLVLFVGRLDRAFEFEHPQNHKNSWFAVNIVRAALDKDSSVRFLMAGAGDEQRREMESRIRDWDKTDRIRLIGVRNDTPRLMRAADVLLFPSRQEGLGMVAVEAQAAGLPVLASTAVPREAIVIPDLYQALPLDASLNHWAGALLRAAGEPRAPRAVCRAGLEASPFSIVNSAGLLERIYSGSRKARENVSVDWA